MPKIKYVERRFSADTQETLSKAIEIIENYQEQGLVLTLRQLYYRFVAAGWIPNTERSYKRLGSAINDGRLAGILDWAAIEDRSRNIIASSTWGSPAELVEACALQFRLDKWEGQECRPEVWVEKQALESVVADACAAYQVTCFACKGYVSQSEMWRAAQRLQGYTLAGQTPHIIHLGDHDPSGVDMSRDIFDRLELFGVRFNFTRIALNMDQINRYQPPPNPAKMTDSRATGYVDRYGTESWELDALEPKVLRQLIQRAIAAVRNEELWKEVAGREAACRATLSRVSDQWSEVEDFVKE